MCGHLQYQDLQYRIVPISPRSLSVLFPPIRHRLHDVLSRLVTKLHVVLDLYADLRSNAPYRSATTKPTRTSKAPSTPNTLLQLLHNNHVRHNNLLHNQLRNAISNFDLEIRIAQIRQYDAHGPSVVGINHTSHGVDSMLVR
jgi:hypothetical protein